MSTDNTSLHLPGEIIVVGASAASLKLLYDILKNAGYLLRSENDGELALKSIQSQQPDLVLLDINLPGIDGFEVSRRLKADPGTEKLPVIFISSENDAAMKAEAFEAGGVDYITKPYEPAEVLARVNHHINLHLLQRKMAAQSDELRAEIESHRHTQRELEKYREHLEDLVEEHTLALTQSEERHRTILETAMDGFWLSDSAGHLLHVNEAYCRMSGYSEQELLTMSIVDLEVIEAPDEILAHINKIMEQGWDRFESRHRRRDGSIYDVEVSIQYSPDQDGIFFSFLRDITERKQAGTKLKDSHDLLENLARLVPGVIYQYRLFPDGRSAFPYSSPGMYDIYEVTPEEVREDATPVFGRLHPDDAGRGSECIFESARTLETFYCEFRVILPKQGLRWRWSQAQPERTEDGGTLWYGIISDITDRKLAEDALIQSESHLKKAQRAAHVGSWEWDIKTNHLAWSDEMYRIFGIDKEDFRGELADIVSSAIHPDDRAEVERSNRSVAEKGKPIPLEYRVIRPDGTIRTVWAEAGELHFDESGKPALLTGIVQDITERKEAERSLEEAKMFLENLSDIAYMADTQGIISWVNAAGAKITRKPLEEIIGNSFLPLFVESDHESLIDVYQRTLQGESLANTLTFTTGVTCDFSSLPRKDEKGEIIGTFGIARDITDRLQAEKALMVSEDRLKKAQRVAKIGNWEFNVASGQVWGSEEAFRIYGIERSSEFLPLDIVENYIIDAPRVNRALVDLITENIDYDIEYSLRRNNNSEDIVFVHSIAEVLRDADGKPVLVIGVIQDITERKRAEAVLQEIEERHRRLFESMTQGVVYHKENDEIIAANPAAAKILGLTLDQLRGKTSMDPRWQAVREDGTPLSGRDHPSMVAMRTGKPVEDFIMGVMKPEENSYSWISVSAIPFFRPGEKKPYEVYAIFNDISKQRHAELNYSTLFREMLDGFALHEIICDENGKPADYRFLAINPSFERMTGLNAQDIVGKAVLEVMPGTEQYWIETYGKVALSGEPAFFENYSEDLKKHFEVTAFRPAANQFACIFMDVTERKHAEEEKAKLEARLLQAQKLESVGRLAGGVAHDFNNMLSVITGNAELALSSLEPSNPLYTELTEIHKAAKRSADLTRQLLAFARKQTIAPKILNLNATIESMLKMLQRLIGEDINLLWKPSESLDPVRIDPTQIDQILANLVVNARDAIGRDVGKVTIETDMTAFDEDYCSMHAGFIPGKYIMLAVSDSGCGMDDATKANIFEPFFTTKKLSEGTGLGLATVYGIVRQNQGFINVYSEPGQGSTFRIYFPAYSVTKSEPESAPVKAVSAQSGHEIILLVEDEPAILKMGKTILEKAGFRVLAASTPGEAINIARQQGGRVDLLMTDVVMPEMNGRDLARQLLSLNPAIKRLFMSGYTANVIAHHGVLDEGVNFLQKPFSMNGLIAKVREVLDE